MKNLNVLISLKRYETSKIAVRRSLLIPALAEWILPLFNIFQSLHLK